MIRLLKIVPFHVESFKILKIRTFNRKYFLYIFIFSLIEIVLP